MDSKLKGMTVNERLYVSGLIKEFDLAVEKKNVNEIILLLNKIEITDQYTIQVVLDQLGFAN